ncbi:hypothetical protein [Amycolatopsis alba]|uniref:hypothetical protein n=1 Tax=Amycolatopsis alba TaxID=76020 RepID=UPI001427AEFC|nr:hypothetical protein [Amycolatopsis alba]
MSGAAAAGAFVEEASRGWHLTKCLSEDVDLPGLHAVQFEVDGLLTGVAVQCEDGAIDIAHGEVVVVAVGAAEIEVEGIVAFVVVVLEGGLLEVGAHRGAVIDRHDPAFESVCEHR